jgi:hypothetical protein
MAEATELYIGVGKVHVRPYGVPGALRFVDNAPEAKFTTQITDKPKKDYTRLGGGNLKKVSRIDAVKFALTLDSFSSSNLALALAASTAAVAAGTVNNEVIKGYKDSTVALAKIPAAITSVTNAAGTTTYAPGTDYVMSTAGLYFPPGSAITDGADLQVDYTNVAGTVLEAAVKTATEVYMLIEGLNEATSGAAVVIEVWRLSVPPADEWSLIGDDFGQLKFAAEVLKDTTRPANESPFYRVRKVNPVAA